MRIAFTGASGTGKTTLAQYVSKRFDLPMNPLGARDVARSMGFVDKDGVARPFLTDRASELVYTRCLISGLSPQEAAKSALDEYQVGEKTCRAKFQWQLLLEKVDWETDRAFVTDRTTVDNLAYSSLYGIRTLSDGYFTQAIHHTRSYDIVFFTPMSSFYDPGPDPARSSTDLTSGHEVLDSVYEALILGLYGRTYGDGDSYEFENNRIVTVTEKDLQARYDQIDSVLRDTFGGA